MYICNTLVGIKLFMYSVCMQVIIKMLEITLNTSVKIDCVLESHVSNDLSLMNVK